MLLSESTSTFVSAKVCGMVFRFAFVGLKGDWPYLRKMMSLSSGFTSKRVCHYCSTSEWWKFGKDGCLSVWDRNNQPLPWKRRLASFMKVPGASDPRRIRVDLAHTWAIGVGKEFVGSALLTICDLNLVPGRAVGTQLMHAYAEFRHWCADTRQCCKLTEFSYRTLKISSNLGFKSALVLL